MMLNRVSLNTIGLNRIGLNRIGKPSRGSSDRPYIDPEVLASLKAVCICYGKSNDDPDRAVVKNLVDPDNPFVISNAAFKLNSGFGKYEVDFTKWKGSANYIEGDPFHFKVKGSGFAMYTSSNAALPSFKVNVIGGKINYMYIDSSLTFKTIVLEEGINIIPESFKKEENSNIVGFGNPIGGNEITITQIPSFEGAFVTDGIDDLITSTKTASKMGITNEVTVISMIHQIGGLNSSAVNYGYTNYFRGGDQSTLRNNATGLNKTGIYGYSATNYTPTVINNILGDKNDYTTSSAGFSQSTYGNVFSVVGYKTSDTIAETSSVAWYWTIIANKVLTTDQINQVIAYFNLDRTLNPDILCDVKKQGITNENHAEFGDKLIDFSGNGRDIQLNNIAWKGDSGIGKYEEDFLYYWWTHSNGALERNSFRVKYKGNIGYVCYKDINRDPVTAVIPSFKVSIEGAKVHYGYINSDGVFTKILLDEGIQTVPQSFVGTNGYVGFLGATDFTNPDEIITITQIPSHAGGLCLDGINDFGKVTGMPIYKDYTFIIDRQIIAITDTKGIVASKSESSTDVTKQGAFTFEYINGNDISTWTYYENNVSVAISNFDRSISYQSKYSYNGKELTIGQAKDSDKLWLGTVRDNDNRFFNGAIYSLMSFPYSMSEFLIERQLKKHKLGTLYPGMVEWRPIIKSNVEYGSISYLLRIPGQGTVAPKIGQYYPILGTDTSLVVYVATKGVDEVVNLTINGQEPTSSSIHTDARFKFEFPFTKSPQKINITIDEYIRYEDIVQPYPLLFEFTDENGNLISWGGKAKVGSTITRTKPVTNANLLAGMYNTSSYKLNGKPLEGNSYVVEKSMVFTCTATWTFDNNEPKSILSPRLLRIPNASYKILGYIPDISGHGNHGVIHNSAYAEGSGVNEDGSYQFDGVDDFVAIPTVTGGKQVLFKFKYDRLNGMLYDQRNIVNTFNFAIYLEGSSIAYQSRNSGKTYIDGVLNENITCNDLFGILHNTTITNNNVTSGNTAVYIGTGGEKKDIYALASLYDFMLFDNISTDDKILELNEYVGIEGNTDDLFNETN